MSTLDVLMRIESNDVPRANYERTANPFNSLVNESTIVARECCAADSSCTAKSAAVDRGERVPAGNIRPARAEIAAVVRQRDRIRFQDMACISAEIFMVAKWE